MSALSVIGFDADDTLWQNEQFFRLSEEQFAALLVDYAEPGQLGSRLLEAERRNLSIYGFGIKGFVLSMIETALEVTEGRAPGHVIAKIVEIGREMLTHPVHLLPGAQETLEALKGRHSLVLITKGDLFDQERKIALSGLAEYFDAIEIVSDKSPATYRRIFEPHDGLPGRALMVGNSLKSDVVPAIEAGAWAVFVPHPLTWVLEHVDEPAESPRYRKIETLLELPALIDTLHSTSR